MKDESLENSVVTLHSRGWTIRKISRELCISRSRIRRILVSNTVIRDTIPGDGPPVRERSKSKLDLYKGFIAQMREKHSDVSGSMSALNKKVMTAVSPS